MIGCDWLGIGARTEECSGCWRCLLPVQPMEQSLGKLAEGTWLQAEEELSPERNEVSPCLYHRIPLL